MRDKPNSGDANYNDEMNSGSAAAAAAVGIEAQPEKIPDQRIIKFKSEPNVIKRQPKRAQTVTVH